MGVIDYTHYLYIFMAVPRNIVPLLSPILSGNLQTLRQLQAALKIYTALGPFTKLAIKHPDQLQQLQEITLPAAIASFSKLLLNYRVQPPLDVKVIRPSLMGLLVQTLPDQYSENALRNLVSKCGEQLNDGIRELNELELQEPQLRKCLISSRNHMEAFLTLLPETPPPSPVSKAIDWIF